MRSGTGSWILSGAVLGVVAVVALSERASALTIYTFPGAMYQWHLSVPISVPPGPSIPGLGALGATPNSDDHHLYSVIAPTALDLTITDVTYDFHDIDIAQSAFGRAAARIQVTLREGAPPPNVVANPTVAPASGVFATTSQVANANVYWSFVGYPNAGAETTVLDSSSFFLIRDLFFDGALSGTAGTAVTSNGLGNSAGIVSPLDLGSNSLDFNSQGVATDCHNFQTGLFVPYTHLLYAGVRVHALGGVGGPGPSGVTSLTTGNLPGFVWLHLQGRMR